MQRKARKECCVMDSVKRLVVAEMNEPYRNTSILRSPCFPLTALIECNELFITRLPECAYLNRPNVPRVPPKQNRGR